MISEKDFFFCIICLGEIQDFATLIVLK